MKQKPTFIKRILIFILALCALFVLRYYDEIHISPIQNEIFLERGQIVRSVLTDHIRMTLASNRIYISDDNNDLKNIVAPQEENSIINYIDAYDGRFFISTYSYRKDSGCIESERIIELDKNGQAISVFYELIHPSDKDILDPKIKSFNYSDSGIYYKYVEDNILRIINIPNEGQRQQFYDPIVLDVPLEESVFDLPDNKLYIKTFFNDIYCFDSISLTIEKLTDKSGMFYKKLSKPQKDVLLNVNGIWQVKNCIYWFSCIYLILFVIAGLFRFLLSTTFHNGRITIILCAFLVISISMFSNMLVEEQKQSYTNILASISNSVLMEICSKDIVSNAGNREISAIAVDENMRSDAMHCQQLASAVNLANKSMTSLYIMGYLVDKDGNLYVAFDTFKQYAFGEYYSNISDEIKNGYYIPGKREVVYTEKGAYETDNIARSFYYDIYGNLKFIVEAGTTDDIATYEIVLEVAMKALHLMALLAFMWTLFDCAHNFRQDINDYIKKTKENVKNIKASNNLAGIYIFIVNLLIYLDFVLLVFVVDDICKGCSPTELAVKFAIPFMAYSVGGFLGSLLTSPILHLLKKRKSAIISSIMAVLIFAAMSLACRISNLYILAAAKFFEGIFVESLLFTLGEGIPYDIEEENERKNGIVSVKKACSAATIVGTMISGLLRQYIGFSMVYMIGVIMGVVLLYLSFIIFNNKSEPEEEAEVGFTAVLKTLTVYFKPKTFAYLIMIVLMFALAEGYTDFIFPLLIGSSGLDEVALADMCILSTTANLFGIEALLPKDRYTPMQLMRMAFTGIGAALLIVFIQQSVGIAFAVLLIIGLFMRPIDNYRVFEIGKIASQYGVSESEIQENYYAIEDGLRMLQAPVLGALCNISAAAACAVVGLGALILPNIFNTLFKSR